MADDRGPSGSNWFVKNRLAFVLLALILAAAAFLQEHGRMTEPASPAGDSPTQTVPSPRVVTDPIGREALRAAQERGRWNPSVSSAKDVPTEAIRSAHAVPDRIDLDDKLKTCSADADCMVVNYQGYCCSQQAAINKNSLDAYNGLIASRPRPDSVCAMVCTEPPAFKPRCLWNHCWLTL